jgi:hypothetical protein
MSKPKRKKWRGRERPARSPGRRRALLAVTVVLAVAIFAVAIANWPPTFLAAMGIAPAASPPIAEAALGALTGRWLRPDGGYILEIRHVAADGTLDAAYLNPRPIRVARAEASRAGSTLKVFVELNAPGYPGSTYTLTYDPKRDQLEGVYFQAALGQSFSVAFVRMK